MKKFTIIKKERVEIEWIGETIPDTETKVICVCDTRETAETALNEIFKSFPAEAKKKNGFKVLSQTLEWRRNI